MTAFVPTVSPVCPDGGWAGSIGHRKEAVVSGDLTDFTEFVRASLPGLLRYGHALTGNPHDAADLVQSVLEKIGSRWGSVQRKTGDPLAYVRRSMANAHISRWRRFRRENLVAEVPESDAPASTDPFEHEPLWQALRELPPRQRAVIVLRYYEGLSEAEIADSLGVSPGTVKSQASKALTSLRGKLRQGEGSEGREVV
ncbi:RNA polymerase subunit sigma-70 [Saccharomonospora piscinae]|uniref:RNA polymerase subunit sigma-70 n=1 Tax=Saccharomonospora piscinae TaxID=687388 RepID=A0A1V9A0W6_SACPI|nr:RNA polymerase subunit sigma-70 [Saccharomonospora piscinae]